MFSTALTYKRMLYYTITYVPGFFKTDTNELSYVAAVLCCSCL